MLLFKTRSLIYRTKKKSIFISELMKIIFLENSSEKITTNWSTMFDKVLYRIFIRIYRGTQKLFQTYDSFEIYGRAGLWYLRLYIGCKWGFWLRKKSYQQGILIVSVENKLSINIPNDEWENFKNLAVVQNIFFTWLLEHRLFDNICSEMKYFLWPIWKTEPVFAVEI